MSTLITGLMTFPSLFTSGRSLFYRTTYLLNDYNLLNAYRRRSLLTCRPAECRVVHRPLSVRSTTDHRSLKGLLCSSERVARYGTVSDSGQESRHPVERWAKMCGCCGLDTAGDKELSEFLDDELGDTSQSRSCDSDSTNQTLPSGFELMSSDGPNVVLTKRVSNELITVRLNVNGSLEAVEELEERLNDEDRTEGQTLVGSVTCRPSFTVEINKDGGPFSLVVCCSFMSVDELESMDEETSTEEETPVFELNQFAMLGKGLSLDDNTYTVHTQRIDARLYELLYKMLEERGLNRRFSEQLLDYCTDYEHNTYNTLLLGLRDYLHSHTIT